MKIKIIVFLIWGVVCINFNCFAQKNGHSDLISSLVFSSDNKQFLSGSKDKTMKLWNIANGRVLRTFSGHTDRVSSVCFSPDGKQALSGSSDYTIKLWDIATGKEIRTFSGHKGPISSALFSHDGRQILSSSLDYTIKLWNIETGREIRTFSGHDDFVTAICFNSDSTLILSGSSDQTVRLWDTATGRQIRSYSFAKHHLRVRAVSFSKDETRILANSSGGSGSIFIWDTATGNEIEIFNNVSFFLSDKHQTVLENIENADKLWNIISDYSIRSFSSSTSWDIPCSFSSDGKQFLSTFDYYYHDESGSEYSHMLTDKMVAIIDLWNKVSGKLIRTF
jgi:WD40 repeat protein